MSDLCEGLMGDLFQPAKPADRQNSVTTAIAELEALAAHFRRLAASFHRDTIIIIYTRCAEDAEYRAAELRGGATPYV
jgi:hypothetical protein